MNFLRTLATPEEIGRWSLTSLRKRLITTGAAGGPWALRHLPDGRDRHPAARLRHNPDHDQRSARAAAIRGVRMTDTATSPIKLDTGDAIAVSNQPENAARSDHNRRMTRPCNATKSVAWKRQQLRSGKLPSAGLTFIVDKPNGKCRFRESPVFPDKAAQKSSGACSRSESKPTDSAATPAGRLSRSFCNSEERGNGSGDLQPSATC